MERLAGPSAGAEDSAWYALLLRSIDQPEIGGMRFPGFPPAELQRRFVGADGATTMREAFRFHSHVKAVCAGLGRPIGRGMRLLDFGCGWGRFLRIWWKDVGAEGLFGCDIHAPAVALCRELGLPGRLDVITHGGALPHADATMDVVMAYSVFTHLSERAHRHWLAEIARVLRPGGILALTLEPPRFLDYVAGLDAEEQGAWQAALRRFQSDIPALRERIAAGDIAFLPTGAGIDFAPEHYGDAVVPRAFAEREWAPHFRIMEWLDDPARFFQAVVIAQRQ